MNSKTDSTDRRKEKMINKEKTRVHLYYIYNSFNTIDSYMVDT
jgi:hypothetical protein